MDLDTWMDTTQVVLRLQPADGPQQLLLSRAGMVGLCGANEAGVGVVVNTLDTLPTAADGLPVAFVVRMLAEMTSLDDVGDQLSSVRHASGQAYTMASTDGRVIGYEAGGDHVASYQNDGDRPDARWHTNHPLAEESSSRSTVTTGQCTIDGAAPRTGHLCHGRLATTSDLKAVLSDAEAGVCMYPGRWRADGFTFGSIVIAARQPTDRRSCTRPTGPDAVRSGAVPMSYISSLVSGSPPHSRRAG